MTSISDNQADVLLLSISNCLFDLIDSGNVDCILGVGSKNARERPVGERVAALIRPVRGHHRR